MSGSFTFGIELARDQPDYDNDTLDTGVSGVSVYAVTLAGVELYHHRVEHHHGDEHNEIRLNEQVQAGFARHLAEVLSPPQYLHPLA